MAQQSGVLSRVLLSYETAYGANPSPTAANLLPVISCGLDRKQAHQVPEVIDGVRTASKPVYGLQDVSGDIVVPVELANLGKWLRAAFGQTTTPWGDGGTQPSLVVEDQSSSPAIFKRFNGMMVNSLALDFTAPGPYQMTLGMVGKLLTVGGSTYDGSPAAAASKIPVGWNHLALSIGGSPVTNFRRFSLAVAFGLVTETHAIAGGGKETQVLAGRMAVTGQVEALLSDTNLWTWAEGGTEKELELVATVGSDTLTITVPTAMFARAEAPLDGPGGRRIIGTWTGYDETRDGAAGRLVSFAIALAS